MKVVVVVVVVVVVGGVSSGSGWPGAWPGMIVDFCPSGIMTVTPCAVTLISPSLFVTTVVPSAYTSTVIILPRTAATAAGVSIS